MKQLTRQEQLVLCSIIGLLLTGLLVKFFRAQQPLDAPVIQAKP